MIPKKIIMKIYSFFITNSLFAFLLLTMGFNTVSAQQDQEAKIILDNLAEKTKSYETITLDFSMEYKNTRENNQSTGDGNIVVKGEKYVLETMGSKVIFDGKAMYNIMEDIGEITITEPDNSDDDFLSNPAKIFTFYERDFKYRYKSLRTINGKSYHEIDLYPKNLNQPYSRIKLLIDANQNTLYEVKSVGKNGEEYLFTITSFETTKTYPENFFTFDKSTYPNAELIDMRF